MKILLTLLASVVVTISGTAVPTSSELSVSTPQILEVTPASSMEDMTQDDSDSDEEGGKCPGCKKDVDRDTGAQGRTPFMRFRGRGITGLKAAFKAGTCKEVKPDDSDSTSSTEPTTTGQVEVTSSCECVAEPCSIKKYTLEIQNTSRSFDLVVRVRENGGISPPVRVKPGKRHKIEFGEPTPTDPDAPEDLGCGSEKVLEFTMVDNNQNVRELKYTFSCSSCPE